MRKIILALVALAVMSAVNAQNISSKMYVEALRDSVENDSTNWKAMHKLAQYYKEHSNSHRALFWTEKALGIHQSDTLRRELATCYYNRGYYRKCIDICRSIIGQSEQNAEDATALYMIARCYDNMEMVDSALSYQRIVADIDIENQANLISFSKKLISLQSAKVAISYLDRYQELDSMNLSVNNVRAFAYYSAGMPKKAISMYEQLISIGDTCKPMTYYYLGMAYNQRNMRQEAWECLNKANNMLQNNNPVVLARLGITALDLPDYEEDGLENIRKAIELMQPDKEMMFTIYFSLGDYYVTRDVKKGIEYFHMAESYKPNDANMLYQIGYCYFMAGNEDKEYQYWSRYLESMGEDSDDIVVSSVKNVLKKIREKRFMEGKEEKPQ